MITSALPPVLPAPVAAPAPAPAAGSGGGGGPESFARMLDAADARRQAANAAGQAPTGPARPTGQAKTDSSKPATEDGPADAPETVAEDETVDTGAASAVEAVIDPALATDAAALLAGLAGLPRTPTAEAAGQAAVAQGTRARPGRAGEPADAMGAAGTTDAAAPRAAPRGAAEALDSPATAPRRAAGAAQTVGHAEAGRGSETFAAHMRQAQADGAAADSGLPRLQARLAHGNEAAAPGVEGLAPGAALPAAAAGHAAPHGGAVGTVAHARLSAGPGHPEFAGQLGAQLTTFVRQGVQHARLELHPVELGPVTVQIAIDGAQARVNLAAEHAATRQALEQAMPALAGSLREAGLTLSGGGVFEQPRQPQGDAGAAASGRGDGGGGGNGGNGRGEAQGGAAAPGTTATAAGVALRRRGVVDLVA